MKVWGEVWGVVTAGECPPFRLGLPQPGQQSLPPQQPHTQLSDGKVLWMEKNLEGRKSIRTGGGGGGISLAPPQNKFLRFLIVHPSIMGPHSSSILQRGGSTEAGPWPPGLLADAHLTEALPCLPPLGQSVASLIRTPWVWSRQAFSTAVSAFLLLKPSTPLSYLPALPASEFETVWKQPHSEGDRKMF